VFEALNLQFSVIRLSVQIGISNQRSFDPLSHKGALCQLGGQEAADLNNGSGARPSQFASGSFNKKARSARLSFAIRCGIGAPNDSPQISATFYDFGTLRPIVSVPLITGPPCSCGFSGQSAVNVTAAVRAGSSTIAIAVNGEIVIAPLTSFQPWPSNTGAVQPVSTGVWRIDMPVNAISALPGTSKLLLATSSRAGTMGNTVVTFDSDTNQIESAAFIGSEPSILSASPDGSAVYAYL